MRVSIIGHQLTRDEANVALNGSIVNPKYRRRFILPQAVARRATEVLRLIIGGSMLDETCHQGLACSDFRRARLGKLNRLYPAGTQPMLDDFRRVFGKRLIAKQLATHVTSRSL